MEKEQDFYREVGERVRERRKRVNMTQQGLASKVSLSRASITNLEMGRQKLMLHTLVDIAAALHVALNDLVPESNVLPSLPLTDLLKHRSKTEQAWIGPALSFFLPASNIISGS